jgi:hypothetical protein
LKVPGPFFSSTPSSQSGILPDTRSGTGSTCSLSPHPHPHLTLSQMCADYSSDHWMLSSRPACFHPVKRRTMKRRTSITRSKSANVQVTSYMKPS